MRTAARFSLLDRWGRGVARLVAPKLGVLAFLGCIAACNVDMLPDNSRPAVINSCQADKDCGSNGACIAGACYSKSGTIDEVLLEITPEASSPLAGISFLSMQDDLRRGDRTRSIALAGPAPFAVQVQVNGEDLPPDCPYLHSGKQTVPARIRFDRVGAVGGVSVAGLSNGFSLTVTTEQNTSTSTSGFSKNVALVPGVYDIYAQPVASNNCQIAPKVWRGVEVPRDGQIVGWAPPSMLDLPTPITLRGLVTRKVTTLADWQLDVVDSEEENVISSSARLGATSDASPATNFEIKYQPLERVLSLGSSRVTASAEPLIRLRPPKNAEGTTPTIYFDLGAAAAVAGNAPLNLDISNLPATSQLVTVSGQVRGTTNDGVRATVKFAIANTTFQGLFAAFGPTVPTDSAGLYTAQLLPGKYRVVVVPEGASDNGSVVAGANPGRLWALSEREQVIVGLDATQTLDLTVERTSILEGVASAGPGKVPAQGATLEAAPLAADASNVLQTLLSPPIARARARVAVNDDNGKFTLALDPGEYELALKPAAASNFAWWILPKIRISDTPGQIDTVNPQLLYPVPVEGTITVSMPDKTSQPLRNATVQAHARTPQGNVTQVGIARTDDAGRYHLALPPAFGTAP